MNTCEFNAVFSEVCFIKRGMNLAEQSDCTNNRNDNISGVYYIS